MKKTKKIGGEDVKEALINELEKRGILNNVYADLINDYMAFWVVKQNLIQDIKTRGVNIEYKNGANQYGTKQNDSVFNLIKTNNQMLKILSDLGLRGAEQDGDVDEDL